jgi:hypothetical protein
MNWLTSLLRGIVVAVWTAGLAVQLASPPSSSAGEVAFEFGAAAICPECPDCIEKFCPTHPTFGLPAPTGRVTGRFSYDPQSSANYTIQRKDVEALGYWQHLPGGFMATFDNITVSADDYVVQLYDDLLQPGGEIADVVTIIYSSDLSPPPTSPLLVNGIPYFTGQFIVSFLQYGGAQFEHPNLAELQGLENFGWAFASLGDTGHKSGTIDVGVALESLQAVTIASADFDEDADVDGSDFLYWQRTVGHLEGGDANDDGIVDGADLLVWKQQFPANSAQASVVPEPNSAFAPALAVLLSAMHRKKLRRNKQC